MFCYLLSIQLLFAMYVFWNLYYIRVLGEIYTVARTRLSTWYLLHTSNTQSLNAEYVARLKALLSSTLILEVLKVTFLRTNIDWEIP